MAKYYVESGTLRMVIQAQDARSAALWALHKTLTQILPLDDDSSLPPDAKQQQVLEQGLHVLSDSVELSEVGFGRADARRFTTCDLVMEWSKLMIALMRLEQDLAASA